LLDLARFVLQEVHIGTVERARTPAGERCRMLAGFQSASLGLDAVKGDGLILHERMEHADRVAAAAYAGYDRIRQTAFLFEDLAPGLDADHPLEVADNLRKRVRPQCRTD